jgi:hypothetical protein
MSGKRAPEASQALHQSSLALTIPVGNVQKFSRVSSRTGPAAQPVRLCLFVGLCLIGCVSANVKSPAVVPAATPHGNGTISVSEKAHWDFFDVAGTRTPVIVPLPKAGNWQIDDQRTPWWVASNTELSLKLEAKLWPEGRRVTPDECLVDLRRWRSDWGQTQGVNPVESRAEKVPAGFDSRLTVTAGTESKPIHGAYILLIGADIGRCFAFLAAIEPTEPMTQSEVLARAALVTEAILPKIRVRAIEGRIETANH